MNSLYLIKIKMTERLWNSFDTNIDRWQEIKEQTKNSLWWLKNEIFKNLEWFKDKNLEKINNDLVKFLDAENISLEDYNTMLEYQQSLYSPKYKDNTKAIELRNIIDVLTLFSDSSKEEIISTISRVYDDKNISKFTKIKLAKALRNNYFWYLSDNTEDGWYVSNPLKWVEVSNQLTKKYPNYDFDSFVLISDDDR